MATRKTQKTADVFDFPAFNVSKMTDTYREFAQKALGQSRENYARVKDNAEEATKTIEATLENAQAGTVELSLKAIDAARLGTENSLSHLEALLGVKSVAEMIELQSTFVRKHAELLVDQTKVMQEAARKVAEDVAKPSRAATEKSVSDVKEQVETAA